MCTTRFGYPNVEVTFSGSSHTGLRTVEGDGPDEVSFGEPIRQTDDSMTCQGPDDFDVTTV